MRRKNGILLFALGLALAVPAGAAEPDAQPTIESLLAPQALFGGVVSENDVGLLFTQLRASLLAAAEGREAPPPSEALTRRMEAIGGELRLRGIIAGLALSNAAERAARDLVREMNSPPGD